ncbi:hypothetical protein V502_08403 [Pseudogymnoascus sp. VKM F-4520 (FW-2644)]|nr:hypothetical protein V502_08403 [Pseudogymnoascus sp. VKM F-4520 (FW-2644)]
MGVLRDILTYRKTVLICIITTLAAVTSGYDLSYFSSLLVLPPFVRAYGDYNATTGTHTLPSWLLSLITSIINLGEVLGAILSYPIGVRFGRRGGIIIACITFLLGILIQSVAPIVALLVIGRFLLGIGIALAAASVPLYIAECAPATLRGTLVATYQFAVGIGLILGTATVFGMKDSNDKSGYLIPMTIQAVLPVGLIIACLTMVPESPRWLAEKGRTDMARKALHRLANKDDATVNDDLDAIVATIERQEKGHWRELLSGPEARKMMLGIGMAGWSQASGINFVVSYGGVILTSIGGIDPYVANFALYCTALPVILLAQYLLERVGRRKVLMFSMACIGCINVLDALFFLFYIAFNLGLGTTIWVSFAEMSVGRNRSLLMSVSTAFVWFFSWVVSFTFPYLYNPDSANLGAKIGFIYGALMFMGSIWVFFLLPETAGRSLEEIDTMFALEVPARKFASHTPRQGICSTEPNLRLAFSCPSYQDPEATKFETESKNGNVVTAETVV